MRNSEKAMVSPDMPPALTRNAVASTGYPPVKKHLGYGETVKKQQLSHQKIESSAANYLRRKGYVPVCHANIVDITFPRDVWLVGHMSYQRKICLKWRISTDSDQKSFNKSKPKGDHR